MKKFFCALLISIFFLSAHAQTIADGLVVTIDSINSQLDIEKSTLVFIDTTAALSLEDITAAHFSGLAQSVYKNKIPRKLLRKPVYLQFSLHNMRAMAMNFYFYPGMLYDDLLLYEKTATGKWNEIKNTQQNSGFIYFSLPASATVSYLVKMNFAKTDLHRIRSMLIKPDQLGNYKAELTNPFGDIKIASYILCGVLLMMIFFAMVNFFLNNKTEFIYYSLFSLCMFFLIFSSSYLYRRPGLVTAFFRGYFDLILLIVGTIFYLSFIRKFLDTKSKHLLLEKLFRSASWVLAGLMLIFTYLHFATGDIFMGKIIENTMKILAMTIGSIFIFMAFRNKDRLMKYLAIGSALQILFSVTSLILIFLQGSYANPFTSPLFYFEIGIISVVFFFLLGLTYKNRRDLIEKTQEQEAMKLEVEKKVFETQLAVIKAQQEERNRISADMHDDLGAGMTSIRLFSELAKTKMGDKIMPEIEKISTSADELLNKMNAIIWSMSSSNDSLGNMVAYIRSYALEYFDNTGIDCKISIPENLPELEVAGEIRRNVFLVVKEALNNAVKHSGASLVKITMQKEPKGLSLLIQDNGRGIDLEKLRQFGNGLKNMKKRMEDVEMEFSIENNNGTIVRLYKQTRD